MLFLVVNSLFILFAVLNINDPDWFFEVLDKNSDTIINMKEPNREAFGVLLATGWIYWTSRSQ